MGCADGFTLGAEVGDADGLTVRVGTAVAVVGL